MSDRVRDVPQPAFTAARTRETHWPDSVSTLQNLLWRNVPLSGRAGRLVTPFMLPAPFLGLFGCKYPVVTKR